MLGQTGRWKVEIDKGKGSAIIVLVATGWCGVSKGCSNLCCNMCCNMKRGSCGTAGMAECHVRGG